RDEPIKARRPTLVQRARKWGRRHRALVWSAATIIAVTTLVLAATLGWEARDRQARRAIAANQFDNAMQLADDYVQKQKWSEANAAAQRSAGLVVGVEGDLARQQRLEQMEADLNMVAVLESLRLLAGDETELAAMGSDFDLAHTNAFHDYHLPVLELEPDA